MEIIQSQTETKAIKNHQCNYCLQQIEKGTKYQKSILKYDIIYTWKNHIHCQEIAKKLNMFDECGDEGLTTDEFIEFINHEYSKISDDDISRNFADRLNYVLNKYNIATN